jgi:hypothetical protein
VDAPYKISHLRGKDVEKNEKNQTDYRNTEKITDKFYSQY